MIVQPAVAEEPVPPAVLLDENRIATATGDIRPLDRVRDVRVFAPWELADRLARSGTGELVCWGDTPIRWRQHAAGDSHRRPSDVVIVKLDGPPGPEQWLEGLNNWTDWLWDHQVAVGWSLGGTSLRLLKAKLDDPLVTTNGQLPEPRWTLGGRQQCWVEPGTIVEGAVELDMQAAYTRVIGGLMYGGAWRHVERPTFGLLERLSRHGLPMLVRAEVRMPTGLAVGPLPRRPVQQPDARVEQLAPQVPYPVTGRFRGLWTWAELEQARRVGVDVRPSGLFVHVAAGGRRPFAPWLAAVEEGRRLGGFAGQLAKATGNALWGQFCIDDRQGLFVQRWKDGRAVRFPVFASKGRQRRAWDIGELVTGTVRAELYGGLLGPAGSRMVCCHTDGGWMRLDQEPYATGWESGGWRTKGYAARLELLDQQHYRVTDPHGRQRLVMSGVPAYRAAELFGALWGHYTRGEEPCNGSLSPN